jgi:uncharacterized membrane protein
MGEKKDVQRSLTLREHFSRGFRLAHRWRPSSFYLLLATPLVLLLGTQLAEYRDEPKRFVFVLGLMLLFFGVVFLRAVMDVFEILRRRHAEERKGFVETLGEAEFVEELGSRVEKAREE